MDYEADLKGVTRPRFGWALTGSGHFFKESLDIMRTLPNLDVFVSKAAAEVIRMYKELAHLDEATEEQYALEFEEPAFITLGLCYEERPRFSGGAYHPVLKRVEEFLKKSLQAALAVRQQRAKTLLELDDQIVKQVQALKAKGLTSPYLKSFVVARVNPIRFRPKDAPPLSFDEALDRMTQAAAKFNPNKVKMDDLAKSGGVADDSE